MSDRTKAGFGLAAFFVLASFPVWQVLARADEVPAPDLELPATATQCVEDTQYMRASHMELLNEWRDRVVRRGEHTYTSSLSGETFEISLTGTCLQCHENKETFCDSCHDYADVEPTCWNCHVEQGEN
jgi:hypothetical protein